MYNSISLKSELRIGSLPLFSMRFKDEPHSSFRALEIIFAEDEHECIVFSDKELPKNSTYEIRGDGIWFDGNCEIKDEHWSFSLESFALRVPVDEYLAHREMEDSLLIGDRIPFGFEIDALSSDGMSWNLNGEILVGKNEIDVPALPIKFILK